MKQPRMASYVKSTRPARIKDAIRFSTSIASSFSRVSTRFGAKPNASTICSGGAESKAQDRLSLVGA